MWRCPRHRFFCPTWDHLIRVGRSLGHRWGISRQLSCSPTHCGRWILRGHRAAPRVPAGAPPCRRCLPPGPPPGPRLGHFMRPPAAVRLSLVPTPRFARRADGVCPRVSPSALRRLGGPLPALGSPLVLARVRVAYARKALPSAPDSDTIPIARRPAVQFNPFYAAGALPRSRLCPARGPPDKSL
jgi:hypothetical protein